MSKMRLLQAGAALVVALALLPASVGAASSTTATQLQAEGQTLQAGAEVLLVAGYSLGECYWEEQEFKVVTNGAKIDKLERVGQNGLVEGCGGGAQSVELTSAGRMRVKMAPLRIHLPGPCVYEFTEMAAAFRQREWGPEIAGSATGKLYTPESSRSAKCAKTRSTAFDVALSGVEAKPIA